MASAGIQSGTAISCDKCGAVLRDLKDKKRFLRRHPSTCFTKTVPFRKEDGEELSLVGEAKRDATLHMLQQLEDRGQHLTPWEQEFIVSIGEWFFNDGKELTIKQYRTLEKIFNQYV